MQQNNLDAFVRQFVSTNDENPTGQGLKTYQSPGFIRIQGKHLKNHVVIKENNVKDIKLVSEPRIRKQAKRFPTWRNLTEQNRNFLHFIAMNSLAGHVVIAFSLNISDSTEAAIFKQRSINYPRDTLNKAIKGALGKDQPTFFFIAAETTDAGRLHFHGSYALPDDALLTQRIAEIESTLAGTLSKGYRQRYNNKRIESKHQHLVLRPTGENDDGTHTQLVERDISCGWMNYCTKQTGSLVSDGTLKRDVAVSQDLRSLSQSVWQVMRSLLTGKEPGVEIDCTEISATASDVIPLETVTNSLPPLSQKKSIFSGFGNATSIVPSILFVIVWLGLWRFNGRHSKIHPRPSSKHLPPAQCLPSVRDVSWTHSLYA